MSYGGFGGFGDAAEESQDHGTPGLGRTPKTTTNAGMAGDRKKQRCIPVTAKVALESSLGVNDNSENPTVFDVPAKYVEIVGQLETVSVDSASLSCVINDGTGCIAARQYFEQSNDSGEASNQRPELTEGSLVHVTGILRTGSDPYISITQVRKLTSGNDVSHHILSVCAAYIDLVEERDVRAQFYDACTSSIQGPFGATPLKSLNKSLFDSSSQPGREIMSTPMSQPDLKPVVSAAVMKDQILNFIRSGNSTQWGYGKQDILTKFKGHLAERDISKTVENLVDDALIYDTGDENHYKAIDG